jgi:cellulose synthase/poly-beta-1,6-N-acetylglucosamine synthase-like glycosyltransferase
MSDQETPLYTPDASVVPGNVPVAMPEDSRAIKRGSGYASRGASFDKRSTVVKRGTAYARRANAPDNRTSSPAQRSTAQPVNRDTSAPGRTERKRQLALLLPGHNEELIIAHTIQSAIIGGQPVKDIFVVDDNSDDQTRAIAIELLGEDHVLSVERSGKALAVQKAVDHFGMRERYVWMHVADADSVFSPDYFREYRKKLDARKYAVAVGFVQSLRGNWISTYRALTYTYSQLVFRRFQSWLGMISVFPGPITCFRMDIWDKLELDGTSLTEDFDITLQVHRKNLGRIVFIPRAVNYTQDPQTFADFWKQNTRWQRGFFQGVRKYQVGLRNQKIDISLGFQMLQTAFFMVQIAFLLPLVIYLTGEWILIPVAIAADCIMNGLIAIWASFAAKRWNMLGALPYFYFLRWVEIFIYLKAFVEVIVFGGFKEEIKGWGTEGRRYALSADALSEVSTKS